MNEKIPLNAFFRGLRPEIVEPLDVWAEKHLVSPIFKGGRFSLERTPYARDILRCLSINDPTQLVVLKMGAQLVKTTVGLAWLAYVVYYGAGAFQHVRTKMQSAREFVDERVRPIWELACLRGKVAETGGRIRAGRRLYREYDGGFFNACGSHSADDVAAKTVPYYWQDETDREAPSAGDDGPAHLLLPKRADTFGARAKGLQTSTPIRNNGPITQLFEGTSMEELYVPCPHCGHMQILEWGHFRWEGNPRGPEEAYEVWFECAACHGRVEEYHKPEMFRGYEWRATHPEITLRRGFHAGTQYAALGGRSWKQMAAAYCNAVDKLRDGDPKPMQVFRNTELGEGYEFVGESEIPTNSLLSRREHWEETGIPAGVDVLVCGGDTQDNRLEGHIMGFSTSGERWTIDYGTFWTPEIPDEEGKTDFDHFTDFWRQAYRTEDGRFLQVSLVFLDCAGHRTDDVINYCRQFSPSQILATIGSTKVDAPTVMRHAKKLDKRRGALYRSVGVNVAKTAVMRSLRVAKPTEVDDGETISTTPINYWHFPDYNWCNEEFFLQLTAEHQDRDESNKFDDDQIRWVRHRARNEVLDTAVLAYAAYETLKIEGRLRSIVARNRSGGSPSKARTVPLTAHNQPARPSPSVAVPTGRPVRLQIGGRY